MKFPRFVLLAVLVAALAVGAVAPSPVAAASPVPARGAVPVIGREFTPTLVAMMRHAERDIVLMQYQMRYYLEYQGSASNQFLHELLAALDRGVRVRVVMDISEWKDSRIEEGEISDNEKNRIFARYLVAHGAEVWEDPGPLISHQKVVVVDGKVSLVSSHNWSFYSTDRNFEAGVLVWSEELAADLLAYYEARRDEGSRFEERDETAPPDFAPATMAPADVTLDAWLTTLPWLRVESVEMAANRDFFPKIGELIRTATTRIEIVQNTIEYLHEVPPYARADRPKDLPPSLVNLLVHDLAEAVQRGVAVDVVVDWSDQRDNSRTIAAASLLRRQGATVFYDDPKMTLHAKMMVVDGVATVVGSTNWTFNAVEQGNEVSVIVRSAEVGEAFEDFFALLRSGGRNTSNGTVVPPITEAF